MEFRRSARVATPFLVAVEGIDTAAVVRQGDLSATGILFASERDLGPVGTVHWLYLSPQDRSRTVHVMAYVVRTVTTLDPDNRRVHRVALEFMPESDTTVQVLQDLVRYVLSLRGNGDAPHMATRLPASVDAGGNAGGPAAVQSLTVRSLVIETSWEVPPGERVIVDITAPGRTRRIRLEGTATRVQPHGAGDRFDVEVEVQREMERPYRGTGPGLETVPPPALTGPPAPLDDLLTALLEPTDGAGPLSAREHLSGDVARIRLPTLCSLFDLDRMTGRLVVRRGRDDVSLWVRDGQIVDVAPLAGHAGPRERLAEVLAWEDGLFDFSLEPVERPDVVRTRTTALLLDLAREADEASR